ncbi:MAG TPA: AAA family ATPase, partial [Ktedonobacteraceae bacterium]|nr:AAA family ATPase [Ktedonobacteraceae bacterium]
DDRFWSLKFIYRTCEGKLIMVGKPVLIIVNGLPGTGKTTLARRIASDVGLPAFSRDGLYETLYDALACESNGCPPLLGHASFTLLYAIAGSILAAGQSLIVEGFFGNPELRGGQFLQLQQAHDFEPFQIMCRTDGEVLLKRILARIESGERHVGHQDRIWVEQNKERLSEYLPPLAPGGQLVEIDTTTPDSFEYADLLQRIRAALSHI